MSTFTLTGKEGASMCIILEPLVTYINTLQVRCKCEPCSLHAQLQTRAPIPERSTCLDTPLCSGLGPVDGPCVGLLKHHYSGLRPEPDHIGPVTSSDSNYLRRGIRRADGSRLVVFVNLTDMQLASFGPRTAGLFGPAAPPGPLR